jgi:hypothetical protein
MERAATFAEHLAEEAVVRGETSFMATLGDQREQMRAGSRVLGGAMGVTGRIGTVSRYIFETGSFLDPQDRRVLSDQGLRALAAVDRALADIEETHHRFRWGARDDIAPFAY